MPSSSIHTNNEHVFLSTHDSHTANNGVYLDSGASDTYLRQADSEDNANIHTKPHELNINVGFPNGTTMQSTGAASLNIANLDVPAHIFPNDQLHTSLLAVADYTNDHDCQVIFSKTDVTIKDKTGHVILKAPKDPEARLWTCNIRTHQANNIIRHELHAELVQFWRRALGSPTQKTLEKAVRKGWLKSIPQLTLKMVTSNPATTMASAKGHLDRTRKNQRPTGVNTEHKANQGEPVTHKTTMTKQKTRSSQVTHTYSLRSLNRPVTPTPLDNYHSDHVKATAIYWCQCMTTTYIRYLWHHAKEQTM